jgi:hypothetical protein
MLRKRTVDTIRREYKIPVETFEKALLMMNFYKGKATSEVTHFKRADGLHVIVSRGRKKKREQWNTIKLEDGTIMKVKVAPTKKKRRVKGETVLKVYKDNLLTHKVAMFEGSELSKFLRQLVKLADGIDRAEKK